MNIGVYWDSVLTSGGTVLRQHWLGLMPIRTVCLPYERNQRVKTLTHKWSHKAEGAWLLSYSSTCADVLSRASGALNPALKWGWCERGSTSHRHAWQKFLHSSYLQCINTGLAIPGKKTILQLRSQRRTRSPHGRERSAAQARFQRAHKKAAIVVRRLNVVEKGPVFKSLGAFTQALTRQT